MDQLRIERTDLASPLALVLIEALNQELSGLYPEEGANHFRLDPEEVALGRGAFFVAFLEGRPVGCAAVRRIAAGEAEIKRMYTDQAYRRRGIGRALLQEIEQTARTLGATRLVLETGVRQPEAIALYEGAGFRVIAPFGEYIGSPLSVCMAKGVE